MTPHHPRRRFALLVASLVALGAAWPAAAQDGYPDGPVTLVVPFPPGGTLDTAARLIAGELETSLATSVLVDNRPGAGGNIGGSFVAGAEPDGQTILMGALSTHGVNVSLFRDMPFDPIADFTPVTMVAETPNVLVVRPDLGAATVAEFVEAARLDPEGFTFASGSSGSAGHLAGEVLRAQTGLDLTHVPYRGSADALQAVLSGEVDFIFDNLASASSHIEAGTLRGLAVTTPERSPFAPDLPTMSESGFEGFSIATWFGILAPAGTPDAVVERLNREIRAALEALRVREALAAQGTTPRGGTPAEFGEHIRSEIAKYAAIIDEAGIEPE